MQEPPEPGTPIHYDHPGLGGSPDVCDQPDANMLKTETEQVMNKQPLFAIFEDHSYTPYILIYILIYVVMYLFIYLFIYLLFTP
jgi:hypothetical protein